jgi:protein-S-isoprenylcysteine O-methyltransferase Ste14
MSTSNVVTLIASAIGGAYALYIGWPAGAFTPYQVVGCAVMLVSFGLLAVARIQLGRSFTASAQARALITHGIYSKIRNPIYVFGGVFIAAVFVYLGMPLLLLIFVVVIPLQVKRARTESRVLEDAFGDEYRAYKAQTWF